MSKQAINDPATDDELMAKIATGCSKSFALLFEAYGSLVLGYATRLMKDRNIAEDMAQEVWVKVAKAAPTYQAQGQFKAWLLTLTRNLCFNKIKADGRLQFFEDTSVLQEEQDLTQNFETQMLFEFNMARIKKGMDELPDNQRISLTLLVTEELSYEQIADHLQISVSATKSLIHRARKNLLDKLKQEEAAS